jgi:plasmid stabilization system protein ParE
VKVVWSPTAVERAAQLVKSMRGDTTGAPWRWLQALLARVDGLSDNGLRGTGVRELDGRPHVGQVQFAPIRVIYRIERDRVVVLTLCATRSPPAATRS